MFLGAAHGLSNDEPLQPFQGMVSQLAERLWNRSYVKVQQRTDTQGHQHIEFFRRLLPSGSHTATTLQADLGGSR